ncbi:uncharacterized protein YecE (DUF72 family) [Mycolicibacterium sp. BK634]|uniref:DUF72 domain-containing protein n=1 Tax=Mycolicibacterium sp. BK634 TaxID=2587099 RepID=UPI001622708E|nr:uncharacterized protein YecE (DUF72 family) [Mycolicibacterium sp. BK634]
MTVCIGTSGWTYRDWAGVLYESGVPQRRWLERYAAEFPTVELNGSFYHWPTELSFTRWREALPEGFVMAVKAPRGLTHARRLASADQWIERITTGLDALGDRRGPLLVQLHPAQLRDDERLDGFLSALPDRVAVAVEFRHSSWDAPEVYSLLEHHGASYVVMSGAGLPCILKATAKLVYVRFHGPDPQELYRGSYSADELRWWADRIREWVGSGHDVLAYFNNDASGNAVRNARDLRTQLGVDGDETI